MPLSRLRPHVYPTHRFDPAPCQNRLQHNNNNNNNNNNINNCHPHHNCAGSLRCDRAACALGDKHRFVCWGDYPNHTNFRAK